MPKVAKSTLTLDKSNEKADAEHVLRAVKLFTALQEHYVRHSMLRVNPHLQYTYGAEIMDRLSFIAKHFYPADLPANIHTCPDFQKFMKTIQDTERLEAVVKCLGKDKEVRLYVSFYKKGGQPFEREILLRFDRR
jgi:hypothetical protein